MTVTTRGRCLFCHRPTIAASGPENAKPRFKPSNDLRLGYLLEALEGRYLDHPRLVCAQCIDHCLPSNIAA
jgi:hypothetical protein